MNTNSHSFHEILIQQLLHDDSHSPPSQPQALRYINKNVDLFASHMCDEQFYVPIKKKTTPLISYEKEQQSYLQEINNECSRKQSANTQATKKLDGIQRNKQQQIKSNHQKQEQISPFSMKQHKHQNIKIIGSQIPMLSTLTHRKQSFEMVLIDRKYFYKSKGIILQISKANLNYINEYFVKQQLYIPILQFSRYQQWQKSNDNIKFIQNYEPHKFYQYSINRYFDYLNREYQPQINEVLTKIAQGKHQKQLSFKSKSGLGFRLIDITLNVIKSKFYTSKLQLLQKTLLYKTRSLNIIKEQILLVSESALNDILAEQQKLWRQIGQLQFVITIQQTQKYCTKNMNEEKEKHIKQFWANYRLKMRKLFEKQISQISQLAI